MIDAQPVRRAVADGAPSRVLTVTAHREPPRICDAEQVAGGHDGEDLDDRLHRFARAFPSQRISVTAVSSPSDFEHQQIATDRFSVNRLRCTGRLRAVGPLPDAVAVGRRTAGSVSIAGAGRVVNTSQPYLRPVGTSEFELAGGAVMLVAVQPAGFADYLERSGQRSSPLPRTSTAPHLSGWGLVMDHAATFLDHPERLTPQAADELHDLLCWSLLHAFDDPWAETRRTGARSTALRRALQYLDEHASETVTMTAVAEAARISVRTLGLVFRRELDTTPLRWLHDLRLDRARLDLLDGRGTVAEIAGRHGITHAGRFAAEYRARFAEYPIETLRGASVR